MTKIIPSRSSFPLLDASYYTLEYGPNIESDICDLGESFPFFSKNATFYTFTGDVIKTVTHHKNREVLNSYLDSQAPKPIVYFTKAIYYPGTPGWVFIYGTPGYMVLFYDKHKNLIGYERINKPGTSPTSFRFNLQNAVSIGYDYSKYTKYKSSQSCFSPSYP